MRPSAAWLVAAVALSGCGRAEKPVDEAGRPALSDAEQQAVARSISVVEDARAVASRGPEVPPA